LSACFLIGTSGAVLSAQTLSFESAELFRHLEQAPSRSPIVLENANYRMEFDATGAMRGVYDKRSNIARDIERFRGTQFKLNTRAGGGAWQEQVLDAMVLLDDGRTLVVGDTERQIAFVFEVEWTEHYLRFELQRVCSPMDVTLGNLYFDFFIEGAAKIYPLDYRTTVNQHGPRFHAEIPWLWGIAAGEPKGCFALTFPDDAAAEDEALLHLWVDGWLPKPKVEGEWTLERARAWLAEWQARYVNQSTMIVQPKNPKELAALCQKALSLGMRRIYLHTDVWRGEYWPRKLSFMHVNREVFPKGETDLKKLADALSSQGVGLAVHTVSCVIGAMDPDYTKDGLDPRLAKWLQAEVIDSVDANSTTIRIRPTNRSAIPTVYESGLFGPDQRYSFIDITGFQIGDEFVQAGEVREVEPGVWELTGCRRAIYETQASAHAAGAQVAGFYRPYRQAFTADVASDLLDEVVVRFGEFFNRVGLSHLECDGLENHQSVPWGRSQFTWLLYQQIDHPTTSNTSSGGPLPWHIEYWFQSSAEVRANHPTGGVAGGDGVPLYLHHPVRPATGPYEIHLKPSERIGMGGQSVHFMRPQPMFGISVEALETHGLSGMFMDSIRLWKQALQSIPDEQRQILAVPNAQSSSTFALRRGLNTLYRPVETVSGLALQPFQAVQPVGSAIPWAWMQEGGPNVPRSYFQVGASPVEMEIPQAGRDVEFTLRVLPSFRPEDQRAVNADGQQRHVSELSQIERNYNATANGAVSAEAVESSEHQSNSVAGGRSLIPLQMDDIRELGAHQFKLKDGYLGVAYDEGAEAAVWNGDRPRWRCGNVEMHPDDGLRLVVFGDGSGASLVVTLHGRGRRDYVFPIDFTGRRELLIPESIASWSRGDWGWRGETRHFEFGRLYQIELGFGMVPEGASPRVIVESLELVSGYATAVNKLSLIAGDAALQIDGPVYTDEYVWFKGGDEVQVYDLNWNVRRSIPVKRKNLQFEAGTYPMQFWAEDTQPHVELQMISLGEPIGI
jgi:hypothetical protein